MSRNGDCKKSTALKNRWYKGCSLKNSVFMAAQIHTFQKISLCGVRRSSLPRASKGRRFQGLNLYYECSCAVDGLPSRRTKPSQRRPILKPLLHQPLTFLRGNPDLG